MNTERLMPLKEFVTYIFQKKGTYYSTRGHVGKHQVWSGQKQEHGESTGHRIYWGFPGKGKGLVGIILVWALFLFVFLNFIYLCIYFWLRWVFAAARWLSLVVVSRGYSLLRFMGFLLRWLLL